MIVSLPVKCMCNRGPREALGVPNLLKCVIEGEFPAVLDVNACVKTSPAQDQCNMYMHDADACHKHRSKKHAFNLVSLL